jgi:hypothetical protein
MNLPYTANSSLSQPFKQQIPHIECDIEPFPPKLTQTLSEWSQYVIKSHNILLIMLKEVNRIESIIAHFIANSNSFLENENDEIIVHWRKISKKLNSN